MASSSRRQQGSRHAHTPALFARSPYARSLRCEALEDRRMLALLTVTTDQDVVDLDDGQTSLREAIFAANLVPGADEIQFDFGHDGPATILLTQGELRIEDSLTITGPGAELLTIDASGIETVTSSSIFNISDGKAMIIDASIYGLTLTGAQNSAIRNRENLTLTSMILTDNTSSAGGALWMDSSFNNQIMSLNIIDTSFVDNTSTGSGGGAIYYQGDRDQITIRNTEFFGNNAESTTRSRGGAISIQGLENQVEIVDTKIKNNSATEGGGVHVRSFGGNVRIVDSDISRNTSWAHGGGISTEVGYLQIDRSTISENTAGNDSHSGYGGGLWSRAGTAAIHESTISGNSATSRGGGVSVDGGLLTVLQSTLSANSSFYGGAIYESSNRSLDVRHSTVSGNHAQRSGGGILSRGMPTITNSTIVDNSAGYSGGGISAQGFLLEGSVVAKNTAQTRPDVSHGPLISSWIAASHSLIGFFDSQYLTEASIGSPDANGNLIGGPIHGAIDPLLGLLADNGGPTLTHALLPGSPAINAGDPTLVAGVGDTPEFDQRGEPFRRIAGGRIDIGAFEAQSLIVDTLVDESDGDFSAGDFSLREAIELANKIAGANTIEFSHSLAGSTISLTIGSLNISDSVEIVGLGQNELTVTNVLTQGPIFNVDDQLPQSLIEVSLAGLTLTGSTNSAIRNTEDLTVDSLAIRDNSGFTGGGIRVEIGGTARALGAKLTVRNSMFTNNQSTAPNSSSRGGGGIYFTGFSGELTIENSAFSGNEALSLGGGVFVAGLNTIVQIRDTTFHGNTAWQGGGVAMIDDITEAVQHAMFERLIVTNNIATRAGGGIYVSGKGLEIIDSHIEGNQTVGTATVASSGEGGGINKIGGGTFIIRGTTISNNLSSSVGGGIALVGPWLTLLDSRVENNTAKSNGGGISILGGDTVELRQTSISGNSTLANGGGLYARGGSGIQMRIFDSTVSENIANKSGGGFYISAGTLDSINTTVSGNQAYESGGGLLLGRAVSQTSFRHNTFTNNTADADQNGKGSGGGVSAPNNVLINFDNTIVAGNFDHSGAAPEISGIINSRYSLIGSGAAFLGPLANNGGLTKTHSLRPGSPAINAGDPTLSLGIYSIEFDQRGAPFARIANGRIDIGAYESQPAAGLLNGDFDGDGDVDGRDFLIWQRGAGTTPADKAYGDATGNNVVDSQDLAVWQETYGQSGLNTLPLTLIVDHEVTDNSAFLAVEVPSEISLTLSDETVPLGFQVGAITDEKPTEDFDFSAIAREQLVDETTWDTAFDNWFPQRAAFDFGDIATRRAVRRSGLVISR